MKPMFIVASLVLAACATVGASFSPQARRGLAIADTKCSGCHAVKANATQSPFPRAPTWEMVVNRHGVNRDTLGTFLSDAHNYPESMQFTLEPNEVDDLVEYLLTLRRADYHPPI